VTSFTDDTGSVHCTQANHM